MARKRAHGEGCLYTKTVKRNGVEYVYWCAQITTGEGKLRQITGKSQAEVREQMTKLTRDRDRGLGVAAERQTVANYLTSWLDTKRAAGLRESAVMRYESDIRLHIVPALGKITLQKLTAQRVQAFYTAKLTSGTLSSTSVRRIHNCLHNALNDAVRLDLVPRNVTELTNKPKDAVYNAVFYSHEQVDALVAAARAHRLEALVVLVVNTGLRLGEVLSLRWHDVDMSCGAVYVRQTRTRTTQGMTDGEPKTDAGKRRVELTAEATDALATHRKRQAAERLRAGPEWIDRDLVFCGPRGNVLHHSNTEKTFYRLEALAGLPKARPHELRHTAASLMIAAGAQIADVSQMLGHSDMAVTMRIYGHLMPHAGRGAMEAMERARRTTPVTRRGEAHDH